MQNKGIVICVAVLLTLASIFYLSFSFATRYYDSEAATHRTAGIRIGSSQQCLNSKSPFRTTSTRR